MGNNMCRRFYFGSCITLYINDKDSITGRGRDFFYLGYRVQTGSRVHPASYSMGIGNKATGM
jgi:hypothetical protein